MDKTSVNSNNNKSSQTHPGGISSVPGQGVNLLHIRLAVTQATLPHNTSLGCWEFVTVRDSTTARNNNERADE